MRPMSRMTAGKMNTCKSRKCDEMNRHSGDLEGGLCRHRMFHRGVEDGHPLHLLCEISFYSLRDDVY